MVKRRVKRRLSKVTQILKTAVAVQARNLDRTVSASVDVNVTALEDFYANIQASKKRPG